MKYATTAVIALLPLLAGCMTPDPTPPPGRSAQELMEARTVLFAEHETLQQEPLDLPQTGEARYTGATTLAYGPPEASTTLLGELAVNAEFIPSGGRVAGEMWGFHAATGLSEAEQEAVLHGDMGTLSAAQQAALIAAFDSEAGGSIDFAGNIAPDGTPFAVNVDGRLEHDGHRIGVGGVAQLGFVGAEAEGVWLQGFSGPGNGLRVTAGGVSQDAYMHGLAGETD